MKNNKNKHSLSRRTFYATKSLLKLFSADKIKVVKNNKNGENNNKLKVAFIHNEKKINTGLRTGASQINQLMSKSLDTLGVYVHDFYPRHQLLDTPNHLKGISNILFFYSLLEHKDKMLKYDIIQGTTYTPLPFLAFDVPVICHFGSTCRGFLDTIPKTKELLKEEQRIFKELKLLDIIPELDFKTFRPLEDIADIETISAIRATMCIATSKKVEEELISMNIPQENIRVIHNSIEDFWFEEPRKANVQPPHLVFLGRLGNDVFTLKIKGFARLVNFYRAFPNVPKTTICMTTNRKLKEWLKVSFPKHFMFVNLRKDLIPGALAPLFGSILFLSSRYEGFSLSLVEGMSQGLVPISFPVGVAPEIIINGVNGFLVTTEKEAEVRARELLENTEMRLAMAVKSKETANQFKSERIATDLLELYQSIKHKRGRSRATSKS